MRRIGFGLVVWSVAVSLAACSPEATAPQPEAMLPAATAPAALMPNGPAATIVLDADEHLQWSASVVRLDELNAQGDLTGKLFGTAGGDPAMNGLYTYVAFFESPAEGWRTFKIGDFLAYRVLAETKDRVDLAIKESVMNDATGEITSRDRNIIVTWTRGADDAPPTSITVTPAQ
jgi:hypothetical protein